MSGQDDEVESPAAAVAPLAAAAAAAASEPRVGADPWTAAAADPWIASRRKRADGGTESRSRTPPGGVGTSGDGKQPRDGDDVGSGLPGQPARKQVRPQEPSTASGIAELLDTQREAILSCVANLEKKVDENHSEFRQHANTTNAKLVQLKSEQGEVGSKVEAVEGQLQQLALQNDQLRATIALADVPPVARPSVRGPRDPDKVEYDIVHLRAHNPVGLVQVQELADSLLAGAAIDKTVAKLTGPPVGRAFRLQLGGDAQTAARRAKKLVESRRVGGKWEESWITRPGDQGREKLFNSLDRSPNEAKRDNNYKSLKRAFVDVVPNAEPVKNDRDGIILCWQPVVRLGTDRESLEWFPAAVVQKLDKQAIEKRYRAILAEYAPRV